MNSQELLKLLRKYANNLKRSFKLKAKTYINQVEGIDHFGDWNYETGEIRIRLVSKAGKLMSIYEDIDTLCHELSHAEIGDVVHSTLHESLKLAMIVWINRRYQISDK